MSPVTGMDPGGLCKNHKLLVLFILETKLYYFGVIHTYSLKDRAISSSSLHWKFSGDTSPFFEPPAIQHH